MANLTHHLLPGDEDASFLSSTVLPVFNASTHHYLFQPEYWEGGGTYYNASDNSSDLLLSNVSTVPPDILDMKMALQDMRFIVQRILVPILTFFGIFGNVTTCLVLTR